MIHMIRIMRFALGAVLVIFVSTAPMAEAQEGQLTASSPVTPIGTETGSANENSFTVTILGTNVIMRCPGSTYTGHKVNVTPHEAIPSGATEATVTPNYVNCTDGTNALTVNMNGCDYAIGDATTTGGVVGTYGVSVAIKCPEGKKIEITGSICTVKVGEQTALTGLHLTDTSASPDDIDLVGTLTASTTICGVPGSTGVQHVDVTVQG